MGAIHMQNYLSPRLNFTQNQFGQCFCLGKAMFLGGFADVFVDSYKGSFVKFNC